jgi:hypothetical protein
MSQYVPPSSGSESKRLGGGRRSSDEEEWEKDQDTDAQSTLVKQRGVFSEYLGRSSEAARYEASRGPSVKKGKSRVSRVNVQKGRAPKARAFVRSVNLNTQRQLRNGVAPVVVDASLGPERKRESVEPKVIVPYQQQAGKPPRRIEIERKKRLYARQKLEDLLNSEGIDYVKHGLKTDHLIGQPCYVPLELFDDTDFESREPLEWVRLGTNEGSGECTIPARALNTTSGMFERVQVTGFDASVK